MYPISTRALASLGRSGRQTARVDVLHDGRLERRLGATDLPAVWDPGAETLVPTLAGTVNVARQQIRRDATISFLDLAGVLTPNDTQDLFAPWIAELRPWVGIYYWDATAAEQDAGTDIEWIPLGTMPVVGLDGDWPQLQVKVLDRLAHLSPFVGGYSIAAGTPSAQALADMLATQVPASHLQTNLPDSEFTTPALLYNEQDASLDAAHALAVSMGLVLYADPMGVITAMEEPSTDDPPAISYAPGPDSMMLRPQRNVDASKAVNVFVATGETAGGAPVRGVVQDNDPDSLTYVQRIGPRPFFYSSPLLQTPAQCELAARATMHREIGIPDTIALPVVPNPAAEAGDVLQLADPDQYINFPLIADSFSTQLRVADGGQTIQCRSRVIR